MKTIICNNIVDFVKQLLVFTANCIGYIDIGEVSGCVACVVENGVRF